MEIWERDPIPYSYDWSREIFNVCPYTQFRTLPSLFNTVDEGLWYDPGRDRTQDQLDKEDKHVTH